MQIFSVENLFLLKTHNSVTSYNLKARLLKKKQNLEYFLNMEFTFFEFVILWKKNNIFAQKPQFFDKNSTFHKKKRGITKFKNFTIYF